MGEPIIEVERVPGRCGGAPTIKGTRIGIHNIVSYAQTYRGDLQKISEEALPDLSVCQIEAALAWYEDNQEEVDAILCAHREGYQRLLALSDSST